MFAFPQAERVVAAQGAGDRAQRDPKAYLGLERMLLHWLHVMAFVVLAGAWPCLYLLAAS